MYKGGIQNLLVWRQVEVSYSDSINSLRISVWSQYMLGRAGVWPMANFTFALPDYSLFFMPQSSRYSNLIPSSIFR